MLQSPAIQVWTFSWKSKSPSALSRATSAQWPSESQSAMFSAASKVEGMGSFGIGS